jgi:hypothetical protein
VEVEELSEEEADAEIKRRMFLYFALCTKKHELLTGYRKQSEQQASSYTHQREPVCPQGQSSPIAWPNQNDRHG